MNENTKKMLTGEVIGETTPRTFTTIQDLYDLFQKLQEMGMLYGLDSFLDYADTLWDRLPIGDPYYETNFNYWLFQPKRCETVAEFWKSRVAGTQR